MALVVDAFDHIVVNVKDVEVAASWYGRVLGMIREDFNPGHGKPPRVSMKFGLNKINLRPVSASQREWFTAENEGAGSDDVCFLTASTPQQVLDHLAACGVTVIEGPVDKRGARGTLVSVYCRDPDGSLIEIASYR